MREHVSAPTRNIELKARCPDLDAAREAARRLGAEFAGTLEQRDTYFVVPRGRLKLRQTTGRGAELVAYTRDNAVEVRGSDYRLVPVPDPAALIAALASSLGVRGDVVKTRELWLWRRVRIHLDRVERLGTFLEFEAVLDPGEPDEAGHAKITQLRTALGMSDEDLIATSYSDLLNL
jgi:predicted adenylyl cyclase CyaB